MKKGFFTVTWIFLLACQQTQHKQEINTPAATVPEPARALQAEVEKHPDSARLRMLLVNQLDSLGAAEQALVQMNALIRKDSLNDIYWIRKAQLQQALHDTSGALRSYRFAIRIYPSPDAMLAAANLFAEKKDSTALHICKEVNALSMGREYAAHTAFISGVYYARTGQMKKALVFFDQTLTNDYHYMEAYMEKGFLFFDTGKPAEALQVFTMATQVNPAYADAWYWKGKCQEQQLQKENAIKAYQQALTLDPGLKEAGAALQRLGAK
jgi:tetratricopeptide (TPR) repeat protein